MKSVKLTEQELEVLRLIFKKTEYSILDAIKRNKKALGIGDLIMGITKMLKSDMDEYTAAQVKTAKGKIDLIEKTVKEDERVLEVLRQMRDKIFPDLAVEIAEEMIKKEFKEKYENQPLLPLDA